MKPAVILTDSSASKSRAPSACAAGSSTGNKPTSFGTPFSKTVLTDLYEVWASDGALKPVLIAPRSDSDSLML